MTSDLTRRFDTIAIEDLNVLGMMSNRHLARSIADMSLEVNWSIKHLCEVALLSLQIDGFLVASYVLFVLKKIRHCYYRCANGRVTNAEPRMIETLMQQLI